LFGHALLQKSNLLLRGITSKACHFVFEKLIAARFPYILLKAKTLTISKKANEPIFL